MGAAMSSSRFVSVRGLRAAVAGASVLLLAACPVPTLGVPRECRLPEGVSLLRLTDLDPTIVVDLRYATTNNFTGDTLPGYETVRDRHTPTAVLRPEAARALARVQQRLREQGVGLKVYDAYRPQRATRAMVFWAERTNNGRLLTEGYIARDSNHNRGNTVDLTLVSLTDSTELNMGTPYDTFTADAHTANATGEAAANRRRLVEAMAAEGWQNYEKEWWHFTLRNGSPRPLDAPLSCF
jgi:zinc D-Ala-D-Ala dipeptidase